MFDKLNTEKAKYEKGIIIGTSITIISFILFIPLGMSLGPAGGLVIAIPFLGGAVYAGSMTKKIKELSNTFKQKYVTEELLKVFPDSQYRYDFGFTEQEVIRL